MALNISISSVCGWAEYSLSNAAQLHLAGFRLHERLVRPSRTTTLTRMSAAHLIQRRRRGGEVRRLPVTRAYGNQGSTYNAVLQLFAPFRDAESSGSVPSSFKAWPS
jgi:hypothetical protein